VGLLVKTIPRVLCQNVKRGLSEKVSASSVST